MKPMSTERQQLHDDDGADVRQALNVLYRVSHLHDADESLVVAAARLEDWLAENVGRWVL
jgi:predicted aconitase